jgi:DNA-binding NtrC family response regulator
MILAYVRDVSRRLEGEARHAPLARLLGSMTATLGTTRLKGLVAATVGLVERHYIEAALAATDGNRTAAAKLLGLSRQGLYAKLSRYGINDDDAED